MRSIAALLASVLVGAMAGGALAQNTGIIIGNTPGPDGRYRAELRNNSSVTLTAYVVELVDEDDKPHQTLTGDLLEMPDAYVRPNTLRAIDLWLSDPGRYRFVFVAGLDADGFEVGDPKRALDLLTARSRMAEECDEVMDFLAAWPGDKVEQARGDLAATYPGGRCATYIAQRVPEATLARMKEKAEALARMYREGAARLPTLRRLFPQSSRDRR